MSAAASVGWTDLFCFASARGNEVSRPAQLVFDQLAKTQDRDAFALVCRDWQEYQLIRRPYSVVFQSDDGDEEYGIYRVFLREDAEQLYRETGRRIKWPEGARYLRMLIHPDQIPDSRFYMGRGVFGIFCLGRAREAREFVGIKMTVGDERVMREARVQEALGGVVNVIHTRDRCTRPTQDGQSRLMQVMEIAGLGSLASLCGPIRELTDERFRSDVEWHIARAVLAGLEGMHRRNRFHMDGKGENVVLGRDGVPRWIDFGCSESSEDGQFSGDLLEGIIADQRFVAPERSLAPCLTGTRYYDGAKIDAWAAGLLLLELRIPADDLFDSERVGRILIGGTNRQEILKAIIEERLASIPELADPPKDSLLHVVKQLLTYDPRDRLTPAQALRLPYFDNVACEDRREPVLARLSEFAQSHRFAHTSPRDLPPPPPKDMVSRRPLQEWLRRQLREAERVVCEGPPGVGKTILARYLVHDRDISAAFPRRFWFSDADQPERLALQTIALARELGLVDDKATFQEAKEAVEGHLVGQGCLAVFDGAVNPDTLQHFMLRGATSLVTTRRSWEGACLVPPFTPDESRRLWLRLTGHVEQVGNNPLFIAHACAHWRRWGAIWPFELERNEPLFGQPLPLSPSTLFDHLVQHLAERTDLPLGDHSPSLMNLPAVPLLACFAPEGVAASWMGFDFEPLIALGLAGRQEERVFLNPFIRRRVWASLTAEQLPQFVKRAVTKFEGPWSPHLFTILELLERMHPPPADLEKKVLQLCAEVAADLADEDTSKQLMRKIEEMTIAVTLPSSELGHCLATLGLAYAKSGQNRASRRVLHRCIAVKGAPSDALEAAHRALSDHFENLEQPGQALHHWNQACHYAPADRPREERLRQLLHGVRLLEEDGADERCVAACLDVLPLLGSATSAGTPQQRLEVLCRVGRLAKREPALEALESALDLAVQLHGELSLMVAEVMDLTARRRDDDFGLRMIRESAEIHRRCRSDPIESRFIEADILSALGHYAAAKRTYMEARDRAAKVTGSVAAVIDGLSDERRGRFYMAVAVVDLLGGREEGAIEAFFGAERALKGANSPLLPLCLLQMGTSLRLAHRFEEGEQRLREALERLPIDSRTRRDCLDQLAYTLEERGQLREALEMRAITCRLIRGTPLNEEAIRFWRHLGDLLTQLERYTQANAAYAKIPNNFDESDTGASHGLYRLARGVWFRDNSNPSRALSELHRARDIFAGRRPDLHFLVQFEESRVCLERKDTDEALRCLALCRSIARPGHPELLARACRRSMQVCRGVGWIDRELDAAKELVRCLDDADSYQQLSGVLERKGLHLESRAAFDRALERRRPKSHVRRAEVPAPVAVHRRKSEVVRAEVPAPVAVHRRKSEAVRAEVPAPVAAHRRKSMTVRRPVPRSLPPPPAAAPSPVAPSSPTTPNPQPVLGTEDWATQMTLALVTLLVVTVVPELLRRAIMGGEENREPSSDA